MLLQYVCAGVVVLACSLYYYFTRTFNYWKSRGVAGPNPLPFFGNLKDTTLRRKFIAVPFKEIYDEYPNEKVVGVYRMTTPCLLLRDLDVIKHVLIKDFDMFVDRGIEFSKEGLGANLFHSDGDTWRVLRNRFTPIFTSGKLKNMLYLMIERGDKFVDYVEKLSESQPEHEVHGLVQRYTMATIAACAFGLDFDTLNEKLDILKKVDDLVLTATYVQEFDMMFPGILKKLNSSLFPKFVSNFFYDLTKNIISQRNGAPTSRNDFMDLLLELRMQGQVQGTKRNADNTQLTVDLTDDVMAAQAFVFYIAGYETSATTMGFMLYEMAKNPEVQKDVIAEVDRINEKYNDVTTYEGLSEMEYMYKVFQETLRKYPIVDPLMRSARMDYKIPGTDVVLKKGQKILISPSGIQYDPVLYPDPERFDPERFSVENSKNRHPCAFLPFGAGPRNCIGMRFAKFQSLVCMSKFFSKFRVEFSENTKKEIHVNPMRLLLNSEGGIYLNIVKR